MKLDLAGQREVNHFSAPSCRSKKAQAPVPSVSLVATGTSSGVSRLSTLDVVS